MECDIAKLKAEHDRTRRQIQRLEERETRRKAQALVGKCFRYRNCYSCPEKPSDYWWLYIRVVSVRRDGQCNTIQFQIDRNGMMTVTPSARTHTIFMSDAPGSYRPISRRAFDRAWRTFKAKISKINT